MLAREWRLLLLACRMLTRIPVARGAGRGSGPEAAAVRYYPLVGVAVGLAGAAVFAAAYAPLGAPVAAVLAVATTVIVTGALHEDGLADTADGIGGGRTAGRALILAVAARVLVLAALPPWIGAAMLVAAHGLSRWSVVLVIASARYVRGSGIASPVSGPVSPASHALAGATAIACLALLATVATPAATLAVVAGLALGHVAARAAFQRKLGGYTGDCLGATQQASEIGACLGLLACI